MAPPYADALSDLAGVAGVRCAKQAWDISGDPPPKRANASDETGAQVKRSAICIAKLVSAKVCRLPVNRDFGLEMIFWDAIWSQNQCTDHS